MSVSIPIQKRLCSLITIKFTWFEKKNQAPEIQHN